MEKTNKLASDYEDRGYIINLIIKFLHSHLPNHPFTKGLVELKDAEPSVLRIAMQGRPDFVKSYSETLTKEKLKHIRESLKMTQTEFGLYVGNVSLRAVQDWEAGQRAIPSTVVEILRLHGQL